MEAQNKIEELSANVKEYVNVQVKLINLKIVDKVSAIAANITFVVIMFLLVLLLIVFGSIALGFYLSSLTGSTSLGFLLLAGIYLVGGGLLLVYRNRLIINPIRNKIIKQMLSNEQ